jgi:hypothetical protein
MLLASLSIGQLQIEWQHCFGGSSDEEPNFVEQNMDGGYIVVGSARSINGDLDTNMGYLDAWVFRTDHQGALLWQHRLGGSNSEEFHFAKETSDGGSICLGVTASTDGDMIDNHGGEDLLLVKFDSAGSIVWQRLIGGSGGDEGRCLCPTSDGGYMIAGSTWSADGDVNSASHGDRDMWVVRTDSIGNILWEQRYGGNNSDWAVSIAATHDGNFIVSGGTLSTSGQVTGHHNWEDYWIIKIQPTGALIWQRDLGGDWNDLAVSSIQTASDSHVTVGYSYSNNGDVSGNHDVMNSSDLWVTRLDSAGSLELAKCYGGTGTEQCVSVVETTSGEILVFGSTGSTDGDVSALTNWPSHDLWIFQLDGNGSIGWQQCFGGSAHECVKHAIQTSDEGYLLCTFTNSNDLDVSGNHGSDDIWLVKLEKLEVGVEHPDPRSVNYYPNPTSGDVSIQVQASGQQIEFVLLDLRGIALWRSSGRSNGDRMDVTVPLSIANGTYRLEWCEQGRSRFAVPVVIIR